MVGFINNNFKNNETTRNIVNSILLFVYLFFPKYIVLIDVFRVNASNIKVKSLSNSPQFWILTVFRTMFIINNSYILQN